MKTRTLGREGLTVPAIGLGCMGMSQGYGPTDDGESIATLRRALELGVTFWDTAQSYGAGDNERLVAKALKGGRDEVTLSTKFGIVRDLTGVHLDARPDRIKRDCEASLERLGTDHIDLYYLHRVDPVISVEDTMGAMASLVAEGKVRHLGISECTAVELERAARVHPLSAVQLEWSLWWREPEDDLVPTARRLGIGIVAFSPLGRGFLAGGFDPARLDQHDYRLRDARFQGAHLAANTAAAAQVCRIAAERGVTPAQLALAWLSVQGDDVVPIPGTKRRSRLEENAAAADVDLSASDLRRLEEAAPRKAWAGNRDAFAAPRTDRGGGT
jgi:aryl-alcohol dehydrogenase-like predicted oxidoreductase